MLPVHQDLVFTLHEQVLVVLQRPQVVRPFLPLLVGSLSAEAERPRQIVEGRVDVGVGDGPAFVGQQAGVLLAVEAEERTGRPLPL